MNLQEKIKAIQRYKVIASWIDSCITISQLWTCWKWIANFEHDTNGLHYGNRPFIDLSIRLCDLFELKGKIIITNKYLEQLTQLNQK